MTRRDVLAMAAAPAALSAQSSAPPKGRLTKHTFSSSKIYSGTTRDYWVYVPAQYKAGDKAALMVFQDGQNFVREDGPSRVPWLFDDLIAAGAMPVTIGVFVSPGVLPARSEQQEARYNRSFEYDSVNDRYARFLIDELLPEVAKSVSFTDDPNLRAIAGTSSGGICAFTAAWFRPDAFRRVLSFIGSFTNLRGGDVLANIVRKTEPRAMRVFLEDGAGDLDIYAGSWWQANQALARSLEWAGYEVKFERGTGGHNMQHGGAIMPDALKWLWQGWDKPITKANGTESDRQWVRQILDPGREWEVVSTGHKFTEGPALAPDGGVYFTDIPANRVHRIDPQGKVSVFREDTKGTNGMMFGPDGRLYACQNSAQRVVAWSLDGKEEVIAGGMKSNDIAINAKGEFWFSEPGTKRVWFVDAQRNKRVVHEGLGFPNGVLLSTDQSLLYVADYSTRWVWSFEVQPDGSLLHGQPWVRLENPDDTSARADGMTIDSDGYLYVATQWGVQVADQPGRITAIIDKPQPTALANVVFAGEGLEWLYATAGDKVFRRKLRRKGVKPWVASKPPKPAL